MPRKKIYKPLSSLCVVGLFVFWSTACFGQSVSLANLFVENNEASGLDIIWVFSDSVPIPEQVWLDEPKRLVMDFDALERADMLDIPAMVDNEWVSSIELIHIGNSLQTVLTFEQLPNYQLIPEGKQLTLRLLSQDNEIDVLNGGEQQWVERMIEDIKFTAPTPGQGLLQILHDAHTLPVAYQEDADSMTLTFSHADIDDMFIRQFDVSTLHSPVAAFEVEKREDKVHLSIYFSCLTTSLAYQNEKGFFVEFIPKVEAIEEKAEQYSGDIISLNFQNIETRAVLQLLADFSDFNIVTSDSVTGALTLRLNNVPWDQALDLILKTKGLDSRVRGNVIMVAPTDELAEQERLLLESSQEIEDLSPLVSELLQVNFAKAAEVATLLKKDDVSMLSPRGRVTTDERTNSVLIYETPKKLAEIKALIEKLDRPIRQVLIEAKIIKATDAFEEALGVQFGATAHMVRHGLNQGGLSGRLTGASPLATTNGTRPQDLSFSDRLNVSLPKSLTTNTGGSGSVAFSIARLPLDTILDLELTALENEGLGEVISSPKLVMANQQTAYIESGEEIPYNETTSSGAASIAFKKAVLRLEVTPQITPDNHIILDLLVNQDSRGPTVGNVPTIDKQEMKTQAVVQNGETIVLGGIYKQTASKSVTKVPVLGDVPVLGRLFRSESRLNQREELLIFVTPKIIYEDYPESIRSIERAIPGLNSIRKEN
jgi:type IV pilus assembly protein PilQ